MNTLIPGAPLRSLSPTSNEYQRAEGVSRAAKPARVARFTLDAPEHSGTIPGAIGDILPPGVALTSKLAVIFTLNQHTPTLEVLESALAKRGLGLRRELVTPSVRTQQCCRSCGLEDSCWNRPQTAKAARMAQVAHRR